MVSRVRSAWWMAKEPGTIQAQRTVFLALSVLENPSHNMLCRLRSSRTSSCMLSLVLPMRTELKATRLRPRQCTVMLLLCCVDQLCRAGLCSPCCYGASKPEPNGAHDRRKCCPTTTACRPHQRTCCCCWPSCKCYEKSYSYAVNFY